MTQADCSPVLIRSARMLRTAMGPQIAAWLDDPSVVEVMLNPDGRVWLDRIVKLQLKADESTWHPEWDITIGGEKDSDPFLTAMNRIKETMSGLHDIGVLGF